MSSVEATAGANHAREAPGIIRYSNFDAVLIFPDLPYS